MCTLTGPFNKRSFTGYKIAVRDLKTGKIRSSCMGFEYKPGIVPIIKRQRNLTYYWSDNLLKHGNWNYNSNMIGRIAVLINRADADKIFVNISRYTHSNYKAVLLIMTITTGLLKGSYGSNDIIAGKYIKSIKILEG